MGTHLGDFVVVAAMTDVTGFGLLGHLAEICDGSNLNAIVHFDKIKLLDGVSDYIAEGCVPGGTNRNFESYGHKIGPLTDYQKAVLCDPQTSGGLLIAVKPESEAEILEIAKRAGIELSEVGVLKSRQAGALVDVE